MVSEEVIEGFIVNEFHMPKSTDIIFVLRTRNGKFVVRYEPQTPSYFYAFEHELKGLFPIVNMFCDCRAEFNPEWKPIWRDDTLAKIWTDYPEQVKKVRNEIESQFRSRVIQQKYRVFEGDIPFCRRKRIDAGVKSFIKCYGHSDAEDNTYHANKIEPSTKIVMPLILMVDIECRDDKGTPNPRYQPVRSVQTKDLQTGEERFFCHSVEKDTLLDFLHYALEYDWWVYWGGTFGDESHGFDDFRYIQTRCDVIGFDNVPWHTVQPIDMRLLYMNRSVLATGERKPVWSSLDYVCQKELGKGKVPRHKLIEELFRAYIKGNGVYCDICKCEENLKTYGMGDVQRIYELETIALGFVRVLLGRCIMGGVLPNKGLYNSVIIDAPVLMEAAKRKPRVIFPCRNESYGYAGEKVGAEVIPPKVGFHVNTVVLDFIGMYLGVIKALNISPDTLDENGDLITPVARFTSKFEGIVPTILREWEMERKAQKDMRAKFPEGSPDWYRYDVAQKSVKTVILSTPGIFGQNSSRFYDARLYNAVTMVAGDILSSTANYVQESYPDLGIETRYGDTDSMFLGLLPTYTSKDVIDIVSKLIPDLNGFVAEKFMGMGVGKERVGAMEIEIDKLYEALILVEAKKRYAGLKTWSEGVWLPEPRVEVAGLEFIRSSSPDFIKNLQEGVFNLILKDRAKYGAVKNYIEDQGKRLLSGEADGELVFSVGLGKPLEEYDIEKRTPPPHVRAAIMLAKDGFNVMVGEKIRYVYQNVIEGKIMVEPVIDQVPALTNNAREYMWYVLVKPAVMRVVDSAFPRLKSMDGWMSNEVR